MHLDRNQLFVDELPYCVLQHLQFFRQIEIHAALRFRFAPFKIPPLTSPPSRGRCKRGNQFRLLTSDVYLSITFSLQTCTNQGPAGILYARTVVAPGARRSPVWPCPKSSWRVRRQRPDWSRRCSTRLL